MNLRPTIRCPCGESNLIEALRYEERPEGEVNFPLIGEYRRSYDCCETCGHYFSRHSLDMTSFYTADYVNATYGGAEGIAQAFRKIADLPPERSDNHHRVKRVSQFAEQRFINLEAGRKLIDIGSGLGVFVSGMKAMGWCCTALDPDERFSSHARNNLAVETITCNFAEASFSGKDKFQCVSLNKVLEHVEDPVGFLDKAKSLLAENGFIYVEVPDGEMAIRDSGFREEFFIDHHHVFSGESLSIMARSAGMKILSMERLREPSGKYTLFAFLTAAHP